MELAAEKAMPTRTLCLLLLVGLAACDDEETDLVRPDAATDAGGAPKDAALDGPADGPASGSDMTSPTDGAGPDGTPVPGDGGAGDGASSDGKAADGGTGGACQLDQDCRLFDDMCTGCDCRALAQGDPNPTCPTQGVQCLVQPCAGKRAACEAGQCVVRPAAGTLAWYWTCGDPVCAGHSDTPGVPRCTTEMAGQACSSTGATCDPVDGCNRKLLCTTSDPTMGPGGCPISRRSSKRDIRYLRPAELAAYRARLLELPLATWRYKDAPQRERLGFILEDVPRGEGTVAVDEARGMVDLYGYTSLTVATVQHQARQIAELRRELRALRRDLAALRRAAPAAR